MAARSRVRTWVSASATALGAGLILSTGAVSVSARPIVILEQVVSAPPGASTHPSPPRPQSHPFPRTFPRPAIRNGARLAASAR